MTDGPGLPAFFRLHGFAELDSTNEEAKRRATSGAPAGTLISARTQRAGRGRRGRVWVSLPGNLYLSIVLRPAGSAGVAAQLGFAAALAVGDAVRPLLPDAAAVTYKWPNDVLVGGRKVSGVLLESQAATEGRVDWLVVGIGVNLAAFPDDSEYPATSLVASGARPVTVEALLEAVARAFHFWYERWLEDGFAPLRQAWLARAQGLGQPLRVRLPQGESEGRFAGLDGEGALLLETDTVQRRVTAGDVFPTVR